MEVKNVLRVGGALAAMMLPLAGQVSAGDLIMDIQAIVSSSITEDVTQTLDFGTIDVAMGTTSTITIDASGAGGAGAAATPTVTSGNSLVTGGNSGIIRVTGAIGMTITIVYPTAPFDISNGTDVISVQNIGTNSGGGSGTVTHTGGTPTDIHVGGELQILGNESDGTYTGDMTITLNYS